MGKMIGIAGAAGMGKTTFAFSLAQNLAKNGVGCLYVSFENSALSLARKAQKGYGNLFYHIATLPEPEHITATVRDAALQADSAIQVIFFDYLQLVGTNNFKNKNDAQCYIARQMKALSATLNLSIVCLSQLNRASGGIPNLSELKDSNGVSESADIVLGITSLQLREKQSAAADPSRATAQERKSEFAKAPDFTVSILKHRDSCAVMGQDIPLKATLTKDGGLSFEEKTDKDKG